MMCKQSWPLQTLAGKVNKASKAKVAIQVVATNQQVVVANLHKAKVAIQEVATKIPASRCQEVAKQGTATSHGLQEVVAIQGVATNQAKGVANQGMATSSQGGWTPGNKYKQVVVANLHKAKVAIQEVATKIPASRCQEVAKQGMATSHGLQEVVAIQGVATNQPKGVAKQGMATSQALWIPANMDQEVVAIQGVATNIQVSRCQEVARQGMAQEVAKQGMATSHCFQEVVAIQGVATSRWQEVAKEGMATSQGLWIPANMVVAIQGVATKIQVSRCQEVAKQGTLATSQA